jgi:hypothetical protein
VERLILKLIHLWRRAAMKKEYVVELTKEEREYLHKLISSGSAPARKLNRARILLKADVGKHAEAQALSDRQIARMLETSTATVQRARERFYEGGLQAALERSKPDRVYRRSLEGRAEAHLNRLGLLLRTSTRAQSLELQAFGGQSGGAGHRGEGLA